MSLCPFIPARRLVYILIWAVLAMDVFWQMRVVWFCEVKISIENKSWQYILC